MLEEFAEITKFQQPLAPYTQLRVGGPAEALVQPRSVEELGAVVRHAFQQGLSLRVLGGGCGVLIRDEGVRGIVLRLSEPAFTQVEVSERRVRAGAGTSLASLISHSAQHGLAGLETMVGTRGTVGGILRQHVADRSGEIAQLVRRVEVMDSKGAVQTRERDELSLYRGSELDDPVLLAGQFELESDTDAAIVKRMRKAWIQRKAAQPFSFQAAGRIFRNPRGLVAAALIEQAGLAGTKVGGAEVSERDANYIVTEAGSTARDVLRLIDLIRSRVQEHFRVDLELEISVW